MVTKIALGIVVLGIIYFVIVSIGLGIIELIKPLKHK